MVNKLPRICASTLWKASPIENMHLKSDYIEVPAKKTRCTNVKCSCRRNGRKCGPECRCKDCTNSNDSDHEDNEMTEDTVNMKTMR